MNNALIEFAKSEAKKHLSEAKRSHDFDHTQRVQNLAVHIAQKEGANTKVALVAAWLHDIARPLEDKDRGVCHATKGAEMTAEILRKNAKHFSLSENEINAITHCIATHRNKGQNKPQTLEAKILFDADKLDSIGAVGIGRTLFFANEIGAKLHNAKEIRERIHETEEFSNEDTAYRDFAIKLRHVQEKLFTKEAKRIGAERHKFMEEFFQRLNKETEGEL